VILITDGNVFANRDSFSDLNGFGRNDVAAGVEAGLVANFDSPCSAGVEVNA
jgi:hypothetical protein